MSGLLAWLTGLPLAVLYPVMTVAAAIENVFPPIPADTIVALGSWLAARGEGSVMGAFLATWIGNVGGAAAMYFVGRRHGAGWMHKRFPALGDEHNQKRLETMYGKYGVVTLVVSRLIPGIRALVPPFAGALKVPPLTAIGAMAIASAVWYGIISYVAFHANAEFSQLMNVVRESGTIVALVAAALLAVVLLVWFLKRRSHERT
jgi:membrane protein DedA with SNARE-associated domain